MNAKRENANPHVTPASGSFVARVQSQAVRADACFASPSRRGRAATPVAPLTYPRPARRGDITVLLPSSTFCGFLGSNRWSIDFHSYRS